VICDCLYLLLLVLLVWFVFLLLFFFFFLFLLLVGAEALKFFDELLAFELFEVGEGDLKAVEEDGGGFLVDQLVHHRLKDLVEGELEAGGVLDDGEDELAVAAGGRVVEAAVGAAVAGGGAAAGAADLDVLAAGSVVGVYQAVNGHGGALLSG